MEEGQTTVEMIPTSVLERIYQGRGREYDHPVRQDDIMTEIRLSDEKRELVEEIKATVDREPMTPNEQNRV